MSVARVPIGARAPEEVNVVIEMPRGSSNKYEYDAENDVFVLDRALYSPLFAPADYGWVAQTLSEDGDSLDIFVISTYPTFTGCVVAARPVGILFMRDEKGMDEKVLAVSARDPRFNEVRQLRDVPDHLLKEITHYFRTYKVLEEKGTEVLDWQDVEAAHHVIVTCHQRYGGMHRA